MTPEDRHRQFNAAVFVHAASNTLGDLAIRCPSKPGPQTNAVVQLRTPLATEIITATAQELEAGDIEALAASKVRAALDALPPWFVLGAGRRPLTEGSDRTNGGT